MGYRETPLYDVQQTAQEMYRMAVAWREDMAPYASYSLQELFDFLKAIPFNADPEEKEVLQRPWYTVNRIGIGGDCDDKAIAAAAWASLNGYPFRFVATAKAPKKELHHVHAEFMINGVWVIFDPTYAYNVLGRPLGVISKRLVLKP